MKPENPSAKAKPATKLAPYSRAFRRGAIGSSVDGRSAIGRLIRDMEFQLVAHVGGQPSVTQKLLIERMIKVRLQLDLLDAKLASGAWTPHDSRTYGGLLNAYRLTAREIGMDAKPPPQPTLAEHLARRAREAAERAAAEGDAR